MTRNHADPFPSPSRIIRWALGGSILPCVVCTALVICGTGIAEAGTIKVGIDSSCDYIHPQDAIAAAADGDVIQLEATSFYGQPDINFSIVSKRLELRGGYESGCTGVATADGRTTLHAQGADTVLEIEGAGSHRVILDRLAFTGGQDDIEGGGLQIRGDVHVDLFDVEIYGNSSENGGGIHLDGGVVNLYGAKVMNNTATTGSGGGIYCTGSNWLNLQGLNIVVSNSAGAHGGGIFADGCKVDLVDEPSISDNTAGGDGGGIHARGGSSVLVYGFRPIEATIALNEATSGGGIDLTGTSTRATLWNVSVHGNTASSGGGLAVGSGASVQIWDAIGSGTPCESACSRIFDNRADFFGGAVSVKFGGRARLEQTWISENAITAGGVTGPVVFVGNEGAFSCTNCMIFGNGGFALGAGSGSFYSLGSGQTELVATTVAGQTGTDHVFAGTGTLNVEQSIFWANAGTTFDPGWSGTQRLGCAVVPSGHPLPPGSPPVHTQDPRFVNLAGGDLHLRFDSPVIDACHDDGVDPPAPSTDIDGELRPMGLGYEPGADEVELPLFWDGFESR